MSERARGISRCSAAIFFNVRYSICEPRVMPKDRTRSLRQDYFLVMCEGSKAPGSSKQARLDDRLTAVLLYSPRAPFMKCKPHKGQDVLSELRIILLERWCDLTLGVMQKRKNRKNKNSNRSSLLLYKGGALCVWIRSCFFVPLQMVATNVKLMQYGFMGFYSKGASSSVRCQSC